MRTLLFAFLFTTSTSAFAQDFYANNFWPGEYPIGFELIKDITLDGKLIPDISVIDSVECSLNKKTVIHPWAKKTKTSFLSISEISSYLVLEDYSDDWGVDLKKGTTLQEVGYLSEGACLYKEKDKSKTFDMTCLTVYEDSPIKLKTLHEGDSLTYWFQATCSNGHKAWFELQDFMTRGGQSVQEARITDYGSVLEY